jgi:hypothetical protein
VKLPVSAGTFPALREFLRGYLHEDWQEDHDSAAEAAQQFCEDASAEEREDVAREWEAFRERTKNLSLPAVSTLLSKQLGAAWQPQTSDQIEAISAVFRPFDRKM